MLYFLAFLSHVSSFLIVFLQGVQHHIDLTPGSHWRLIYWSAYGLLGSLWIFSKPGLNPRLLEMAEGQTSNILKAMEYRKSDLFSRLKGENQFILDSNFRKLYIVLYEIILNICPFPCIQTYTHTFTLTQSLLPILYFLVNPNTIFPPESFDLRQK